MDAVNHARSLFLFFLGQGLPIEEAANQAVAAAEVFERKVRGSLLAGLAPLPSGETPAPASSTPAPAPAAPRNPVVAAVEAAPTAPAGVQGRHQRTTAGSPLSVPAGVQISSSAPTATNSRVSISVPGGPGIEVQGGNPSGYSGQLAPGQARVEIVVPGGESPPPIIVEPGGVIRTEAGQPVQQALVQPSGGSGRAGARLDEMARFRELQGSLNREQSDALRAVLQGQEIPAKMALALASVGLLDVDGETIALSQLGREVYYATRPKFEVPS